MGGHAAVLKAQSLLSCGASNNERTFFGLKVLSKEKHLKDKAQARLAIELTTMRDLEHSRFLKRCHAASTDVFFVCDFIENGDLFHHMACRMNEGNWGLRKASAKCCWRRPCSVWSTCTGGALFTETSKWRT
jgi:hypothetical protein